MDYSFFSLFTNLMLVEFFLLFIWLLYVRICKMTFRHFVLVDLKHLVKEPSSIFEILYPFTIYNIKNIENKNK